MDNWKSQFKLLLDEIERNGSFAVSKKLELPPPKISVEGMRLAFPLQPAQADQLIAQHAEQAPYGRGSETVLDESVRKAWQMDSSKVVFHGDWQACLQNIVNDNVVPSLGLSVQVEAHFYKMLLYDQGGHFAKHRDTEKEPGMFATLVIQLPSKYQGGALVITHGEHTKTYNYAAESEDDMFVTAFYADCEHELQPVTDGYRLCLVYNLVMDDASAASSRPSAGDLTLSTQQLQALVTEWNCNEPFMGYLLEHKYTETNLSFQKLKGRDREVANFLRDAVRSSDGRPLLGVALVLLEKHESGSAEERDGGYRRRYYDESDDDESGPYVMADIIDSESKVHHWVGPDDCLDDCKMNFSAESHLLLDLDDGPDEIYGEDPDREEYEGYMGNYGPTLEYWYYQGAIVFWPASSTAKIAKQAGRNFLGEYLNIMETSQAKRAVKKAIEKACFSDKLAHFALTHPDLLDLYVDAVINSASSYQLKNTLRQFLEDPQSASLGPVRKLAATRAQQLRGSTANGPPSFSWAQPRARFDGSNAAAVQAFLHGNQKSKTFHHFSDLRHARNWVNKYFGYARNGTYSATARAGSSRHGQPFVEITKTRLPGQQTVQEYNADVAELNSILSIFGAEDLMDGEHEVRRSSQKRPREDDSGSTDNPVSID